MVYTPELYAKVGMKTADFEAGAAKVNKGLRSMESQGGMFQRSFSKIGKMLDPTMLIAGFTGGLAAGGFLAIGNQISNAIGGAFASRMGDLKSATDAVSASEERLKNIEKQRQNIADQLNNAKTIGEINQLKGELSDLNDQYADEAKNLGDVEEKQHIVNQQTNIPYENALASLNKSLEALRTAFTPLLAIAAPALQYIADWIKYVADCLQVFVGIVYDTTHSSAERLADLAKWLSTVLVDLFQSAVNLWEDVFMSFQMFVIQIGQGIANALIDGINAAGHAWVNGISGLYNAMPEWAKKMINGGSSGTLSWNDIGHVSIDTSAYQKIMGMEKSTLNKWIDDMQSKFGLNVTLGDLEKKYNINVDQWSKTVPAMKDLNLSLKDLKDTVDANKLTQTIEINVHQVIEGTYSPEQLKALETTTYNSIEKSLRDRGLGAST